MEYKVKVEMNGYDYCKFDITAPNERDAVATAVSRFANDMLVDAPGALACGAITWTVEPVRAWSIRNVDDPQVLATGEFELDKYGNFVINFPPLDVGEYRLSYGGVNIPMKVSEKSDENL